MQKEITSRIKARLAGDDVSGKKKQVNFRITEELDNQIEELCEKLSTKKAELLTEMLEICVDKYSKTLKNLSKKELTK